MERSPFLEVDVYSTSQVIHIPYGMVSFTGVS